MKTDRLLGIIIYLLNHNSVSAGRLAERFEVSVRTIQRDIDSISMAGIPIVSATGANGGYSLLPGFKLENQFIKKEDFKVIILALKSLNTGYEDSRLEGLLDKYLSLADTYSQNVFLDYSVTKENDRVLENNRIIEDAVNSFSQIEFDYRNTNGYESHKIIRPLALRFKWYAWYLFGLDIEKNDFRTYKAARITNLIKTAVIFKEKYDVEKLLYESDKEYLETCEIIDVWCKSSSINILEEYFPGEIKEAEGDGNYIMHLHVPPNERLWQALLLSLGDKVKIIKPEYYKLQLIETAVKFLSNYDIQMS